MCTDDRCLERQRKLIECLTYEETATRSLDDQLLLDVRSLVGQLAAAEDATERSTAAMFNVAGQLDAALAEYQKAAAAVDAAVRAHADQWETVRNGRNAVDSLRGQLIDVKTEIASIDSRNERGRGRGIGVYVTGCEPGGQLYRRGATTTAVTTPL